jgi:hypothetical protein
VSLQRRRHFIALFALLAFGLSHGFSRADTPEQIKNAEEYRLYHPLHNPQCEGDILVDMDGIRMVVPRSSRFTRDNGDEIKQDLRHPMYDCTLESLDHIGSVSFGDLRVSAPRSLAFELEAKRVRQKRVAQVREHGQSAILASGIEKISSPGVVLYVLPLSQAPTGDDDPVVFECVGQEQHIYNWSFCNASYELPNKLRLSYSVQWKFLEFARTDQEKRAFVEIAIQKAQQLKQPGDGK